MQGELLRNMKADSFTVDMEPFSHLSHKDLILSSRIIRSPSRKGSDKKMISNYAMHDGDGDTIHSPKAFLMAGTMPEKLMLLDHTANHINSPQVHHQIAIMTGGTTPTTATSVAPTKAPPGPPTKSSAFWKRSRSFKQSSIINPRRILIFFATLSSIGTVLLICLTLSVSRYNEDDNSHA
ncbi:uncharacterized protein LOC143529669 [Bidens hawaiensis]|uniref:uncharacterized protein LOC143529669 n=1 Tax=Bidens hawaiensis TaxID=980011 RepID=UPI00404B9A86